MLLFLLLTAPSEPAGTLRSARLAQAERPSEDDMFGSPATKPVDAKAATPDTNVSSRGGTPPEGDRDAEALQGRTSDAFAEGRLKEDNLKLGGRFYLRAYGGFSNEQKIQDARFSVPLLVDVYLDARPMDRLRAQILGRMQYDPFLSSGFAGVTVPNATPPANPSVGLDQAWIAFDIARTVFITAGRQHVKWGTSRLFNPTDFLSAQFRDPLAQFDARLGVTMLKLSIPWEAKGWNFYAVAVFEPTQRPVGGLGTGGSSGTTPLTATQLSNATTGTTFGDIGGAARIELTLFGNTQIALDGMIQRSRKARGGFDITTAIGPVDVYGEIAVRAGSDLPVFRKVAGADLSFPNLFLGAMEQYDPKVTVGTSGGLSYDIALPGKMSLSLGGEYFYNSTGYDDYRIYPYLIFNGAFQPFYNGRHYAAVTAAFIDNSSRTTTVLSNIGNLSDRSFITRVDFSVTVFSYLTVEAFAAVHYGQRGGEFRFAYAQPELTLGETTVPAINIVAPLLDLGLGLRMSL